MTPYGYRIINAEAVIDESEAEKVKELYREFLTTGSMRKAAMKVGIDKVHSVIGRILKNRVYLGTDYYPQIIDEALFSAVQKLREKNARNQNRIHEYKAVEKTEIGSFYIGSVDKKYNDPYKQAEYAYGLIEEDIHE